MNELIMKVYVVVEQPLASPGSANYIFHTTTLKYSKIKLDIKGTLTHLCFNITKQKGQMIVPGYQTTKKMAKK